MKVGGTESGKGVNYNFATHWHGDISEPKSTCDAGNLILVDTSNSNRTPFRCYRTLRGRRAEIRGQRSEVRARVRSPAKRIGSEFWQLILLLRCRCWQLQRFHITHKPPREDWSIVESKLRRGAKGSYEGYGLVVLPN